jgi:hypothetical protein
MGKHRLALAAIAALATAGGVIAFALTRGAETESVKPSTTRDALVDEFRTVERTCLAAYNGALADQRANRIDEAELANIIERDVLAPWRALRQRVDAAPPTTALYRTLRRYLELRQIAWEAYVTALRAPTDEAARPHLEIHRQKNAEAQEEAKRLGRMFRPAGT